jgi:hypothetical protein
MGCHISDHNTARQITIHVGLLIGKIEGISIQIVPGIFSFL